MIWIFLSRDTVAFVRFNGGVNTQLFAAILSRVAGLGPGRILREKWDWGALVSGSAAGTCLGGDDAAMVAGSATGSCWTGVGAAMVGVRKVTDSLRAGRKHVYRKSVGKLPNAIRGDDMERPIRTDRSSRRFQSDCAAPSRTLLAFGNFRMLCIPVVLHANVPSNKFLMLI